MALAEPRRSSAGLRVYAVVWSAMALAAVALTVGIERRLGRTAERDGS